ncbi:MAG: hypothetical protein QGH40_15100 [bacterium]|nr:hypothetical protein [bacterium]
MMRLNRDDKGVAPVLEYLFAFTVFVLVLSVYFTSLGTLFPGYNTETTHLEEKCLVLSDSLMGNTGWLKGETLQDGGTEEWETHNYNDLNHVSHLELVSLGLCAENDSYGLLSYDKITALEMKVDFNTFAKIFSLNNNLHANITVETENDIISASFGATVTKASREMVTVERICVIWKNEARIMGKLTVKLFYGGVIE